MQKSHSSLSVVGVALVMVALLAGSAYVFGKAGTSDDLVAQVNKAVSGPTIPGSATKPPSTASTTPPTASTTPLKLPTCMFKPVDCAKYEKAVIDAQEVLDSDLLKLRDLYKDQAKYERQLTENRKQQKEIIDELVYQYSLIEGEQRDIANIQEEITSVQRRLTDPGITPQKKAQLQQQLKKLQEQLFESQEVVKVARATVEYLDGELQSLEEAERRINAALAGVNESITRMNAKIRTDESELAKAKRNLETCRKLQQQAIDLYLSCVSSFY